MKTCESACSGSGEEWFRQALPWSKVRPPEGIQDHKDPYFKQSWRELVKAVVLELEPICLEEPVTGFERIMSAYRALRTDLFYGHLDFAVEMSSFFWSNVSDCFEAMKLSKSEKLVEQLYAALTHEDLDESDLPEDIERNLSHADALSLLERFAQAEFDIVFARRATPIMTSLALALPFDEMMRAADHLALWPRLEADRMLKRFLAERSYDPPFASLAVQTISKWGSNAEKVDLLDYCLRSLQTSGRRDVAQEIRFSLFTKTLSVGLAKDWLSNLPGEAEWRLRKEYVFQQVRQQPSRGKAMMFFLDWPDLASAVAVAECLPTIPGDIDSWQLQRASQSLEEFAPSLSFQLLQKACNKANGLLRQRAQWKAEEPTEPTWFANWPASLTPAGPDHG